MQNNIPQQKIQDICFQCERFPADKSIVSDLGICRQCYKDNIEFLEQLFEDRIRDGKLRPSVSEIIPGKLYLGNQDASVSKETLEKYGITHILVAGAALQQRFRSDFKYFQIDINDAVKQEIVSYLDDCYKYIESGEKVFVHCHAGVSRSASVVIGYLMKKEQISYQKAFELVQQKRDIIRPNSGFEKQLKEEYQQRLGIQQE